MNTTRCELSWHGTHMRDLMFLFGHDDVFFPVFFNCRYEKHPAVKQYLHPILRVHTHRQDSTMVSLLKFATRRAVEAVVNEDVASGLLGEGEELESSQVRNNQRVRKVWSFVMQILKEDPSYLATTWGKTYVALAHLLVVLACVWLLIHRCCHAVANVPFGKRQRLHQQL